MQSLVVVCADIGSVKNKRFGWYADTGESSNTPSSVSDYVASVLKERKPVALGFECPLFVPLPKDEQLLGSARRGEGNRPWSAAAGSGSLTTGLVQVAWVLQVIREQVSPQTDCYLSWEAFASAGRGLFIWEAFVSGESKRGGHVADAISAVEAFREALPNPGAENAIEPTSAVYSLAGAAMLRAGWSDAVSLLSDPCIVIRSKQLSV